MWPIRLITYSVEKKRKKKLASRQAQVLTGKKEVRKGVVG